MIQGGRGYSSEGTRFGPVWLGPHPVARGGRACVAEGRLDPDVLTELHATSPAEAVLAAFERHGDAFPAHLRGELAFALWDGEKLRLGRDAFGVETIFWRGDRFSSDADALGRSGRLDPLRVAEQLTNLRLDGSLTFDAEIHELLPGCIWEDGRVYRWFHLDVAEDERPVAEITASILVELRRAITVRRPSGPVAVALSGGLDSSTIAAILRDQRPPVQTISVRWDHPAADERRFVRRLIATGGLDAEAFDGEDHDPFSPTILDICGPGADPFAASTDAMIARAPSSIYFGFDADNVVSLGFESLADRARQGAVGAAWAEADAVGRSYGLSAWQLFRQAAWPLLRPWRAHPRPPAWVAPRLLREVGWEQRVRAIPRPRSQREDHAQALLGDDGRALRNIVRLARARGVTPVLPFMDVGLARLFLGIPARHRLGSGFDRILFRRAIAGVVPEDIRWRRGKALMTIAITRALHRWLPPLDLDPIAEFVAADGVRGLYERFRASPTPDDGYDLWRIMALVTWLRHRH